MLSFDYQPSYASQGFFRPQRLDPFGSLISFAAATAAHHAPVHYRHAKKCRPQQQHQRHQHHHHHHHHQQQHRRAQRPRTTAEPLFDFFNILEEPKNQRPQTYAKIFNGKNTFKIVIGDTADYKSYSINYKVSDRTLIYIESEEEDFQKIYSFANGVIDVENITWELVNNSLVIHIPKVKKTGCVVVRSAISIPKAQPTEVSKLEVQETDVSEPEVEEPEEEQKKIKRVETTYSQPTLVETSKSNKPRVISIKIDFEDSDEKDVPSPRQTTDTGVVQSDTESLSSDIEESAPSQSESEGEVESKVRQLVNHYESANEQPSPKLPKLSRKVSIEEIEDEGLQQMDVD